MATALEKARKDPDSMKARILVAARNLFAEYGYHGVTTRMIAREVGIDISTLHYHWGDKQNLYEAVIIDLNDEIRRKLMEIENEVHGKSISVRLEVAIEIMCDYLFSCPEASKLIMALHFNKTRSDAVLEDMLTEDINNIAYSMGLTSDKRSASVQANALVLAVWIAVFSFTSGESFLRPVLHVERKKYIDVVKETLKFILIPAFTKKEEN